MDWSSHTFVTPERAIFDAGGVERFRESPTVQELMSFMKAAAESVIGLKVSDAETIECEVLTKYEVFIAKLKDLIEQIPPISQPSRFGNKAFRTWHAAMVEETATFMDDLLPQELKGAAMELSPYITGAFGNEIRIDYGTGHELCFLIFFLCLFKLHLITEADFKGMILRCFNCYLQLMRTLQVTYMLEPAGSHGVWGLDDYHCLLFLWGSAQLCKQENNEEMLSPRCIHNNDTLEEYADEYLYLGGIKAIKEMKKGAPFAEIAPMLNDISQLPEWTKLLVGLCRLFHAEVLMKHPVVQHIPFGTIFPFPKKVDLPSQPLGARAPPSVFN